MTTSARIAAAMASGYLLGRRRKIKLAIMVGGLLAGKRIATTPRGLLKQANEYIEANPELAKLSESVRTTLLDSARQAAVGTASNRINRLSDTIHDRVGKLAIAEPSADGGEADGGEADVEQQADEEQPDEEQADEQKADEQKADEQKADEQQPDEDAEPAAKKAAPKKRQAAKKTAGTKSTAKKSGSSGSSTPAKKATSSRGSRTAKKAGSQSGATKARG